MSSVDGIIAALQRACDLLTQAAGHAGQAARLAGEIRDLGKAIGVRDIAERFASIADRAEQVRGTIATGADLAREAMVRADEARGHTLSAAVVGPPVMPTALSPRPTSVDARTHGGQGLRGPDRSGPSSSGGNPMDPATSGWTRVDAQDAPQHVRDSAQDFEPRLSGQPQPTTARYDGRTLTSGGRHSQLADDLAYERIARPDGRPYPRAPNVLYEHPEMKVAADMRRRGLTDAEVVVDNSMCGTRVFDREYPLTCSALLPGAMPSGTRMTVWATTDGGRTFYRSVVHGTGSLIRP